METNTKYKLAEAYKKYLKEFPASGNVGNTEQTWGFPVVIGGFAVLLQGGPRTDTQDLDLAVTCNILEIQNVVKDGAEKRPKKPFSKVKGKGTEPTKWYISIDDETPPIQFDCVPVGQYFVNKSLQSVDIGGIKCASVPDLVLMKAKVMIDPGKRTLEQRANDAKDFGFLLQKMVDGPEKKMPERLNTTRDMGHLQDATGFTPGGDTPDGAHARARLERLVADVLPAVVGSD